MAQRETQVTTACNGFLSGGVILKKRMKTLAFVCILIALPLVGFTGCKKKEHTKAVLHTLYQSYADGEISECKLSGETVFTCTLNAHDAPTMIYDQNGNEIGICNYAWGSADEMCYALKKCDVVYRVENNIWGKSPVDKYKLKP